MKTLLLSLVLSLSVFSQSEKPSRTWLELGHTDEVVVYIDPIPVDVDGMTVGFVKTDYVSGKFNGLYVIQQHQFSCSDDTLRIVYGAVYDLNNKLLKEDKTKDEWRRYPRHGGADIAVHRYWCKNL